MKSHWCVCTEVGAWSQLQSSLLEFHLQVERRKPYLRGAAELGKFNGSHKGDECQEQVLPRASLDKPGKKTAQKLSGMHGRVSVQTQPKSALR